MSVPEKGWICGSVCGCRCGWLGLEGSFGVAVPGLVVVVLCCARCNVCVCGEAAAATSAALPEACSSWKGQSVGLCLASIRCTVTMSNSK